MISADFKTTAFHGTPITSPIHITATLWVHEQDRSSVSVLQANENQTKRMVGFLDRYMYPNLPEENEVVVKMFRHILMHTGELRFLAWPSRRTVYTWSNYFGNEWGMTTHYKIDDVDPRYQDQLLSLASWVWPNMSSPRTRCIRVNLKDLARDIERATNAYLTDVSGMLWNSSTFSEYTETVKNRPGR